MLSSLFRACGIVVLLSCFDTTFAQIAPPLTCNINAGNPTISRADGVTELVGDYVLQCSGGTPTPVGQTIPSVDVQLTLNANITNRLVQGSVTDALLMIDEPYAPLNQRVPNNAFPPPPGAGPQNLCAPSGVLGGSCTLIGTGGSPSPYTTQPNIFVGTLVASNAIRWSGVPLDPPGASGTLVVRLTNIRANASQLGLSGTLIPSQIVAFVSATGVLINNPQQTLAFLQPSAVFSRTIGPILQQCTPHNASLLGSSGTPAFDFNATVKEGFANSLKRRNIGLTSDGSTAPQVYSQNLPGYAYNDETGFYAPALFTPYPNVGLADHGSRIRIQFNNVGTGTHIFVPISITLTGLAGGTFPIEPPPPVPPGITTPQMRLIQADINGNSPDPAYVSVAGTATIGSTPVAEANYAGTTAFVTYEVVNVDPSSLEQATIPVAVAFATRPAVGQVSVNMSLAPLSSVSVADASAPIPRFVDNSVPLNVFSINTCSVPQADFNQDGHPDLIWQDPASGQSQIWFLGDNAGVTGSAFFSSANSWRLVGTADFDGDGHTDVVWQDPNTGQTQVWFLGGAQGNTILGAATITTSNSWRIVGIGDFDGDRRPDLIWQDPVTGHAQVWFLGGSQGVTITGTATLTSSNSWRIAGVGDFNHDGYLDLVWQDPQTGASQVWFLGGAQGVSVVGAANLVSGNPWRIAAILDFNGDGQPDVVWQDPASGMSQVWFMGGAQGVTVMWSTVFSGPNSWRIVRP